MVLTKKELHRLARLRFAYARAHLRVANKRLDIVKELFATAGEMIEENVLARTEYELAREELRQYQRVQDETKDGEPK